MRHTRDKRRKKAEPQAGRGSDSVRTDVDGALGNHGAVGLVDDAIDLLEVIRVRDDLVVGDEVLFKNLRGQFWLFFLFFFRISQWRDKSWRRATKCRAKRPTL